MASLKAYIIGFALSVVLTLTAAALVSIQINSGHTAFTHPFLIASLLILAIIQLFVQLVFFLHLASETGPRWRLAFFISTVGIVFIVVIGSIWILNHLNYNMMASPSQMNAYIQSQDGL